MMDMMGGSGNKCECHHHSFLPILVILFAILFLLGNAGVFQPPFVGIAWPILVGLGGILMLGERKCTCC